MHSVLSSFCLICRWLWETGLYFTPKVILNGLSYLGTWPPLNHLKSIMTHQLSKLPNKLDDNSETYSCDEEDADESTATATPVPLHPVVIPDMGKNCIKGLKEEVELEISTAEIESCEEHQEDKGMNMSVIEVNQELDTERDPKVHDDALPEINQVTAVEELQVKSTDVIPSHNQSENVDAGRTSTGQESTSKPIMSTPVPSKKSKTIGKKKNKKKNKRENLTRKISEHVELSINNELGVSDDTSNTASKISTGELGRGIEGANNSCYLDSTLFSMFYYSDIFDSRLLRGEMVKDSRRGDENSDEVTNILVTIVSKMRGGYCPSEYTAELRHRMMHINKRLRSDMMDVDELISNLCGRALHLQPFVTYSVGTTNYLHQILINPSKQRARVGHLQDLLIESMQMQGLKLANIPEPALIIKMPRSNGQLVGHQYILPNLTLDLTPVSVQEEEGQCTYMDLMAVIVLRYYHYTAFVRCGTDVNSPWVYYNDLPANVTLRNDIGEKLSKLEATNELENVPQDLRQIMGDIHVCIYQPHKLVTSLA